MKILKEIFYVQKIFMIRMPEMIVKTNIIIRRNVWCYAFIILLNGPLLTVTFY